MSFFSFITKQRDRYSRDLQKSEKYYSLSATSFSNLVVFKKILKDYVKGKTLDAGAGALNGRLLLEKHCREYVSLDINNKEGNIDIVDDIQNMSQIHDGSFDTVYSSQVLEHVPRPWDALKEIYRVLKKDGYVIISVPHLSALHEEPHDYYRYTPYGLKFLMEQAGFKIEGEYRAGGFFTFISHPFSLMLVSLFWSLPVICWIVWWFNKIFIINSVLCLDKILKFDRKFPSNIIIVGKKESGI